MRSEYIEEYYLKDNPLLSQFEVRFFSEKDRLVYAQKYDETSEFTFEEAQEMCKNIKECLEIEDIIEEDV